MTGLAAVPSEPVLTKIESVNTQLRRSDNVTVATLLVTAVAAARRRLSRRMHRIILALQHLVGGAPERAERLGRLCGAPEVGPVP